MSSTPFLVMKENNGIRRSPQILALEEAAEVVEPCVSENRAIPVRQETDDPWWPMSGRARSSATILGLNTVGILGSDNSLLFRAVLCPVRHFITSLASAPWMSVPFPRTFVLIIKKVSIWYQTSHWGQLCS